MGSIDIVQPSNPYAFPLRADEYAPAPTPSLSEWQQLWKVWDLATRDMIPEDSLHEKPISLRNDLIFYLGHIPTFEDIHLSRALNEGPTPPKFYQTIFERGIDPDVDDPNQCHDHSEIPDSWPELDQILEFQQNVRARIASLYSNGKSEQRVVQRALWIGFEHECLHLETFLFMTIQSDAIQAPPGVPIPDFRSMAIDAQRMRVENQWIKVAAKDVVLGISPTDPEDESEGPDRYHGWDNERPLRKVHLPEFEAKARPITNEEYVMYMMNNGVDAIPKSWLKITSVPVDPSIKLVSREFAQLIQSLAVRTVYGHIPLQYALDWPLMASFDELQSCATWLGGDIPTLKQVRSIHQQVEAQQQQGNHRAKKASNRPDPLDVHVDMEGQNIGFNHFHPTPVTQNGSKLCSGLGGLGGAGEQTSSRSKWYDGFKPMDIYPGYTADFMDGKHYLAIGGSWALHPRIGGRKSFVSWWQPNYGYAWNTARLVRNVTI